MRLWGWDMSPKKLIDSPLTYCTQLATPYIED